MKNPLEIALDNNLYQANILSENWKDALRTTANILENNDFITETYVEKIISDTQRNY